MLNVWVAVDDLGHIRTSHYVKPTAIDAIPLCTSSMHNPAVHRTWPAGYIKSILSLCDSSEGKQAAVATFLANFKRNDVEIPSIISSSGAADRGLDRQVIWMPLPYHPLLAGPLKAAIRKANSDDILLNGVVDAYDGKVLKPLIRIAWRNSRKPHWMVIRASNSEVLKQHILAMR